MLTIHDLTRKFADHTAVSQFELKIEQGEFVTLLGPSGSGKSTVLRMIAGLLEPSSGEIRIDGKDVTHLPAKARNIGFVFQSYALFPHLTAFENVAFPLRVRKWSKSEIEKRVSELFELVGLQHRAQYHPELLSGGERQRIALARALAFHPPLLLLDEPLSALDAKVRISLREFLKEIQRTTGVTTLMVTHDQEEALALADRIVVMNTGSVEQIGTPYELYHEPATPFTARFIGNVTPISAQVEHVQSVVLADQGNLETSMQGTVATQAAATYTLAPDTVATDKAATSAVAPNKATMTWAGGSFQWLFKEPVEAGEVKTVFVRPESVEVRLSPKAGSIRGIVTSSSFLGAVSRMRISVNDESLLADVHSHQLLGIAAGTEVFLHIVDSRLTVWESSQASGLDGNTGVLAALS